ncbi:TnsA-like heteromeric transposase endonuclease subunit [Catellatospora bangladeshensis]|uniref:TnsA-like heteromeric transposase endonuclease subunit n=1 Tax=Catellatospora bangladeshensis TaxID=310355 RepID=UPI003605F7DA
MCLPFDAASARAALDLGAGWPGRWSATWRLSGASVACAVRDLALVPRAGCQPVRRFSWRAGQRHRPGLQFLVSTGRHHGFESVAEQRLLLVLDFAAELTDVLSQPFRLRFASGGGWREHVPDFLALTRAGGWLIDVRPGERIEDEDRVCFAAANEAALACGWRYTVVTGWRSHVIATVDTLSAQRRPLVDQFGLQAQLLAGAAERPRPFGELVQQTKAPAVARAHLLHLLWRRQLGIDLGRPLADAALVWRACW